MIMGKKTNKDVMTVDSKQERLLFIRVLRQYGKENGIGQFKVALKLISVFYRGFGVQYNFIRDKGLLDEFEEYFLALEGDYDRMFRMINNFIDNIEYKIVPKFGV